MIPLMVGIFQGTTLNLREEEVLAVKKTETIDTYDGFTITFASGLKVLVKITEVESEKEQPHEP
jgi:hypothetical protein